MAGKKAALRRSTRSRKVETSSSSSSSSEAEEEELEVQEQYGSGGGSSSDEQDEASSAASENEEDEGEDALQADGYGDDGDDGASEGDSDGDDGGGTEREREQKQIYTGDESCTLDLRNLTAINSHQVNTATLYQRQSDDDGKRGKAKKKGKKRIIAEEDAMAAMGDKMGATIPPADTATVINEDQLLETARDGCQQILRGLWSLETERTDAGPMGLLPQQFEIKTPRELVSAVNVYLAVENAMCLEFSACDVQ